ncbi:MAG: 50S ribosomal protein L19, partial [Candidatus Peribacteraceae bacterium]|nr:50S ribosomal protein L19 [Candidatus Peribacteraceae bacterium]
MTSHVVQQQVEKYGRTVPNLAPGNTVRVHERVQEGEKERTQIFEGLIIAIHKGHVPTDRSFTVRKIVSGVGVEKVFPLHSPMLQKVQVTKEAKVRRSKLNYLRDLTGKKARMREKF